MKGKKQNDRSRHFLAAFRHDDFTGLGPRESDLRRRRTDKVERNKCDKPKRDSVVAASRRYLKVNVLWRTAANRSNTSCTHAFLINQPGLHPLSFSLSFPTRVAPPRGDIDAQKRDLFFFHACFFLHFSTFFFRLLPGFLLLEVFRNVNALDEAGVYKFFLQNWERRKNIIGRTINH